MSVHQGVGESDLGSVDNAISEAFHDGKEVVVLGI